MSKDDEIDKDSPGYQFIKNFGNIISNFGGSGAGKNTQTPAETGKVSAQDALDLISSKSDALKSLFSGAKEVASLFGIKINGEAPDLNAIIHGQDSDSHSYTPTASENLIDFPELSEPLKGQITIPLGFNVGFETSGGDYRFYGVDTTFAMQRFNANRDEVKLNTSGEAGQSRVHVESDFMNNIKQALIGDNPMITPDLSEAKDVIGKSLSGQSSGSDTQNQTPTEGA